MYLLKSCRGPSGRIPSFSSGPSIHGLPGSENTNIFLLISDPCIFKDFGEGEP